MHRALPDALTCARILCALFPRLCAHAATVGDAVALLGAAPPAGALRRAAGRPPAARGPAGPVRAAPGPRRVRLPRRARPAAVRGQVGVAAHARALALLRPRRLDRTRRDRRLPGHQLRAGRAGAGEPADQALAAAGQQGAQAHRPLGVRALPAGHRVPRAGGEPRAGRGPRREHRPAAGQGRRPRAGGPPHLDVPAAPLRTPDAAPRAPVDLRPDGPLLLALPRRPRPQRLPPPGGRGAGAVRRPRRRRRAAARAPGRARSGRPRRRAATSARRRWCAAASAWRA